MVDPLDVFPGAEAGNEVKRLKNKAHEAPAISRQRVFVELLKRVAAHDDAPLARVLRLAEAARAVSAAATERARLPKRRDLAIEAIMETVQLQIESSIDASAALIEYRAGPADFADCLIGQVNRSASCTHTVTFDRKAAKLNGFKLLPGA